VKIDPWSLAPEQGKAATPASGGISINMKAWSWQDEMKIISITFSTRTR